MFDEDTGEYDEGSAKYAPHKRKRIVQSHPTYAGDKAIRTKELLTQCIRQRKGHRIHGFNDFELFKSLVAVLVERSTKKIQKYLKRTTAIVEYVLHNAYTEPFHTEGSATASLQRALFHAAMEVYDQKRKVLLEDICKICKSELFPNSASVPAAGTAAVFLYSGPPPTSVPSDAAPVEADHLLRLTENYWGTAARNRLVDVVTNTDRRNWHELLDTEIEALLANVTDEDLEEMMKESESTRITRNRLNHSMQELQGAMTLLTEVL
jgi:hypothetical protein